MTRQEALINLRTILSDMYPEEPSARRVVQDAGLNLGRIAFSGTAINTWNSILREAENANMMDEVLRVVLSEFPRSVGLRRACDDFRRQMEDTSGTLVDPPSGVTGYLASSPVGTTMKILFLAANPTDTTILRLDEESRGIDKALRQTEYRDRFELEQSHAVRVEDLQELLLRYQPHIVHFSGHGSETGEILLKDDSGDAKPISPEALASLFGILKDNVRCVVLNACFSEKQARAIAEHIDCVMGMSRAILDSSAIEFSTAFYRGMGYGRSVQTAFDLGCNQIGLAGKGIVRRHLALVPANTGQGSEGAVAEEAAIPQLISLRLDPAEIVLVRTSGGTTGSSVSANSLGGAGSKLSKLTGSQFKQFQAALLSAFDLLSLRQMVSFELSENINAIAGGSNLSAITFGLIEWAQRTGNLDRLLDGALAAVPGNTDLQTFAKIVRGQ